MVPLPAPPLPPWPQLAGRWAAGGLLAAALLWLAGVVAGSSAPLMEWNPALGRNLPAEGTVWEDRGEGGGGATLRALGCNGLDDPLDPATDKVVFLGDSHVLGSQVTDAERLHGRLGALLRKGGRPGWAAVGHGLPYQSCADSVFWLRRLGPMLPRVRVWVVVTSGLTDTLPDQNDEHRVSTFRSAPGGGFALAEFARRGQLPDPPQPADWRRALWAARPNYLADLYRRRERLFPEYLRWTPGPAPVATVPVMVEDRPLDPAVRDAGWRFLLGRLREAAGGTPVLLLYLPLTPRFVPGVGPEEANPEGAAAARLAEFCASAGVGWLSLEDDFGRHHAATGRFARGFDNGLPGLGHLNREGHDLAARAVLRWLDSRADPLSPLD